MKRFSRMAITISAVMMTAALFGCANEKEDNGKLNVVCTVCPVYEFTKTVTGDDVNLSLMVKPGEEPHDWEPSTSDMMALEKADVLIMSGAGMEKWIDSCLDSIENKDLKVLDASSGADLMEFEDEEGEHEEEHGHVHHGTDPHYWLSIDNAVNEVKNISGFLINEDPDNADKYKERSDEFARQAEKLKGEYETRLSSYAGQSLVVSHEAFGYLCRDLKLTQVAIDGLSEDSEPGAKTIAMIVERINDEGIGAIFYDELLDPSAARTIGDETGCRLLKLNTFETLSEDDISSAKSYLDIMRGNLDSLTEGFSGGA